MKKTKTNSSGKLILFSFLFLLCLHSSRAQNPALNGINFQLRNMFASISKPNPPRWFLYDMAAHVTDSTWFQTLCHDTNETDIWNKVYEEMYHSSFDTSALIYPDTLFNHGNNFNPD